VRQANSLRYRCRQRRLQRGHKNQGLPGMSHTTGTRTSPIKKIGTLSGERVGVSTLRALDPRHRTFGKRTDAVELARIEAGELSTRRSRGKRGRGSSSSPKEPTIAVKMRTRCRPSSTLAPGSPCLTVCAGRTRGRTARYPYITGTTTIRSYSSYLYVRARDKETHGVSVYVYSPEGVAVGRVGRVTLQSGKVCPYRRSVAVKGTVKKSAV
jgi:hypothetical protein